MRERVSCRNRIVAMRSDAEGQHLAVLNDHGMVRVFDPTGKRLAEHTFELGTTRQPKLSIDISPDGSAVLFDNGLWSDRKAVWKWESDDVQWFEFSAGSTRLASTDMVMGIWFDNSEGQSPVVKWLDLARKSDREIRLQNCLYKSPTMLEGVVSSRGLAGISFVCEDFVSAIAPASSASSAESAVSEAEHSTPTINFARYHSLWPQNADSPKYLAYDGASQSLCLLSGKTVVVFAKGEPSYRGSNATLGISFWSFAIAGNTRRGSTCPSPAGQRGTGGTRR